MNWALLYFASEWLVRAGMLFYVPRRRSPAAARTWLLLLFMFPWPGLAIYAAFGRPRLPRRRMQLHADLAALLQSARTRLEPHTMPLSDRLRPELRQAVALAGHLGDFGICGGNRFELLADYSGILNRLIEDIEGARHHVHLLYYIFADDDVGRRISGALQRAVGRGVHCRVLMDGFGSRWALRTLAPSMRSAGIEVRASLPFGFIRLRAARSDLRNHRKLAIIDGHIAYFGSQNMIRPELADRGGTEELVARVTGPLVSQLQTVFLMDWCLETGQSLQDPDLFPEPASAGSVPAQLLPSGPAYPNENAHEIIVALIYGARERVVITTPYFIPDEPFLQAMRAGVHRGIEVNLIVTRRSGQPLVDLAQRSYYDELLAMGVRIYLYNAHFLHAKHVSIDDCVALIGSSNMDIRSFALNSEISVLIYDQRVVAELNETQQRYLAKSQRLTQAEWDRRRFSAKILQNIARLADSLL